MRLIDLDKVYESACAGCTRHGDAPGECYYDEPCERLIFAFTTAEPVDAAEVVRCKDCKRGDYSRCGMDGVLYCAKHSRFMVDDDFCSYGEKRSEHET